MRRIASLALLCLASAWISAQQKADQPAFRSGVELVQLDVSVLDGERRPVRGLTAADFTVLENGTQRPIRTFAVVDIPVQAAMPQPVWAKDAPLDVTTNQIAQDEGRLLVILMDRSIPMNGTSLEAQKIAIAAVDALGPRDLAALVSTSGAYTPQNFTSDRARLVKAIVQRDWSTESSLYPWRLEDASDPRCFCGLCVLETVSRISDALRNAPRRRKVLLFIGQGITITMSPQPGVSSAGCEMQVKPLRQKLFDSLAVSGLTVHSIDPKALFNIGDHVNASVGGGIDRPGVTAPQTRLSTLTYQRNEVLRNQESLAVLPDRTGGRRVVNTNALTERAAEIIRESDAYYVLGFERDPATPLDTRRSVSVKVGRKNVRAFTQRAFVTPGGARGSSPASASSISDDALTGFLPLARRALAMNLGAFATSVNPDRATVRVTLDATAFANGGAQTILDIKTVAFDQTGKEIASATQNSTLLARSASIGHAPAVDISTQMDLEPGDYEVRVAAREHATGVTASVFGQIAVPKFSSELLSLSDLVIEIAGTPTTARAFAPGNDLRTFFQIYQGTRRTDAIVPVTVRTRVLDASGAIQWDDSKVIDPAAFHDRRVDRRINLPLDRLVSGEHLLDITASGGNKSATRKLRFSVR